MDAVASGPAVAEIASYMTGSVVAEVDEHTLAAGIRQQVATARVAVKIE